MNLLGSLLSGAIGGLPPHRGLEAQSSRAALEALYAQAQQGAARGLGWEGMQNIRPSPPSLRAQEEMWLADGTDSTFQEWQEYRGY